MARDDAHHLLADARGVLEALGFDVDGATADSCVQNGAFCTLRRLSLPKAGGRIHRLIAKFPRDDERIRATARALGLFERERRFYAELAPDVPIAVPACSYTGSAGSELLLLEDLGGLRAVDQIAGLDIADAERAIDALACLHAAYWDGVRRVPLPSWLVGADDRAFAQTACSIAAHGAPILRQRYRGRLSQYALDATASLGGRFAELLARCAQGPLTLAHGDARVDNLLFRDEGMVVFIDWQVPARARGSQDVAYLLSTSLAPEVQAAHALSLLRRWHEALADRGVRDYGWDDALRHYREHVLYSLFAAFALMGSLNVGEERTERLADALVLRNVGHAEAIGAFDVL